MSGVHRAALQSERVRRADDRCSYERAVAALYAVPPLYTPPPGGQLDQTREMASSIVAAPVRIATPARASAPATCSACPARAAPRAAAPRAASLASRSRPQQQLSMVRSARAVRSVTVRAAAAETTYETYEVELEKPLQVKFGRGNDGGAYVTSVGNAPGYEEFEIGDKISKVRCVRCDRTIQPYGCMSRAVPSLRPHARLSRLTRPPNSDDGTCASPVASPVASYGAPPPHTCPSPALHRPTSPSVALCGVGAARTAAPSATVSGASSGSAAVRLRRVRPRAVIWRPPVPSQRLRRAHAGTLSARRATAMCSREVCVCVQRVVRRGCVGGGELRSGCVHHLSRRQEMHIAREGEARLRVV